ncbi:MAG: thioredoxin family protein [Synergistaceae bacterium]|nr:thioredoxin family protein [Synergistaceae bacterium]
MKIQILGTGCPKCKKLVELAETAAKELGLSYEIEKVTDISKILDFGAMSTPGLALNGKVVLSGHLPSSDQIKRLLAQAAGK